MPFGLKGAPVTFHRLMDRVLVGLHGVELFVYIDNIVVYACPLEEHDTKIDNLFTRLSDAGLRLQPEKCAFLSTEVCYLGHVISTNDVQPNPKKIEAVKKFLVFQAISYFFKATTLIYSVVAFYFKRSASDIAFKAIFLVIKAQSRMRKISLQEIRCKPFALALNIQVCGHSQLERNCLHQHYKSFKHFLIFRNLHLKLELF